MRPVAKSVKKQVRSTESSHIVKTTIRLSYNAVSLQSQPIDKIGLGDKLLINNRMSYKTCNTEIACNSYYMFLWSFLYRQNILMMKKLRKYWKNL